MEISVGPNPNTPPTQTITNNTPWINNNTPWTTPPFVEEISYRFNWLNAPSPSKENSKLQFEYYEHDNQSVIYTNMIEDANHLREILQQKFKI